MDSLNRGAPLLHHCIRPPGIHTGIQAADATANLRVWLLPCAAEGPALIAGLLCLPCLLLPLCWTQEHVAHLELRLHLQQLVRGHMQGALLLLAVSRGHVGSKQGAHGLGKGGGRLHTLAERLEALILQLGCCITLRL